ncbi:hypothetical protein [Pyrobaculum aerophilum]|uniref:hypothetical protein n=1 Tax=Pyrobaculum aerophilum TaxID=13773 RepID=UPI0011C022B4|nr:hypothetical protein [Pyrobaculum aerophilum]
MDLTCKFGGIAVLRRFTLPTTHVVSEVDAAGFIWRLGCEKQNILLLKSYKPPDLEAGGSC